MKRIKKGSIGYGMRRFLVALIIMCLCVRPVAVFADPDSSEQSSEEQGGDSDDQDDGDQDDSGDQDETGGGQDENNVKEAGDESCNACR